MTCHQGGAGSQHGLRVRVQVCQMLGRGNAQQVEQEQAGDEPHFRADQGMVVHDPEMHARRTAEGDQQRGNHLLGQEGVPAGVQAAQGGCHHGAREQGAHGDLERHRDRKPGDQYDSDDNGRSYEHPVQSGGPAGGKASEVNGAEEGHRQPLPQQSRGQLRARHPENRQPSGRDQKGQQPLVILEAKGMARAQRSPEPSRECIRSAVEHIDHPRHQSQAPMKRGRQVDAMGVRQCHLPQHNHRRCVKARHLKPQPPRHGRVRRVLWADWGGLGIGHGKQSLAAGKRPLLCTRLW